MIEAIRRALSLSSKADREEEMKREFLRSALYQLREGIGAISYMKTVDRDYLHALTDVAAEKVMQGLVFNENETEAWRGT